MTKVKFEITLLFQELESADGGCFDARGSREHG